jgi:hypothetical protein
LCPWGAYTNDYVCATRESNHHYHPCSRAIRDFHDHAGVIEWIHGNGEPVLRDHELIRDLRNLSLLIECDRVLGRDSDTYRQHYGPDLRCPGSSAPRSPPGSRAPAAWPWLLAGLLALATLASLATARRQAAGWLCGGGLLIVGVWAACGGGGSAPPPPPSAPVVSLSTTALALGQQGMGST